MDVDEGNAGGDVLVAAADTAGDEEGEEENEAVIDVEVEDSQAPDVD